jgi:photosystem II stability/assembly factor-like uncharacterized protein
MKNILLVPVVLFSLLGLGHGADVSEAGAAPEGHDISWQLAGPSGGGWIQSLAFDPRDKDVLYAGCDVGGFFISTNAGRTFEIRNRGLHDYFLEAIAVHPQDSRIILLGTESGIHRTADRGLTWEYVRKGFPPEDRHRFTAPIGAVCFDPLQPSTVYAGLGRPRWDKGGAGAIYRSEDTGANWRRVDGGQLPGDAIISAIAVQPGNSRTVLAATSAGIFRSDDAGTTWKLSSDGLPHLYAEELAFAPSAPQTVYVTLRCTAKGKEPWNGGVFRSDDAGRTWRGINGAGLPKQVSKDGKDVRHFSANPKELAVDPRDANVLYIGHRDWVTAGVYKTTDGGAHWQKVARKNGADANMEYGWLTMWGPSVQCLALSPAAPDRLAFGTSGTIFVTDDQCGAWRQRYTAAAPEGRIAGNGLAVTCAWRVQFDPVRTNRVYLCYMDIGLLISDDLGATCRRSVEGMQMGGNCFGVLVDPQATNTLWAATGWWNRNAGDLCRSDDDGRTWRVVGQPAAGLPDGQVLAMALDPRSKAGQRRLVVISNGNGVFETCDGGASWKNISGDLGDIAKKPCGLLLDPADGTHLIVAVERELRETRDGGRTWQQLHAAGALPVIKQLVADPRDFRTLYIAGRETFDHAARRLYQGGLYRSADGGHTWQRLLADRYVAGVAVSPVSHDVLYVTTKDDPYHDDPLGVGVLKSADGGRTWRRENSGLTLLNPKGLAVSPHDPATLLLGTSGNSVFLGRDAAIRNVK